MADEKDTPRPPTGGSGTGGSRGGSGARRRSRSKSRNRSTNRPAQGQKAAAAGRNGRPGAGRSGSPSPGRTTKTIHAPEATTPQSLPAQPGIGGPQIHPAEVAANRRRAVALCGYTAIVPSLLVAALCWVAVSAVLAGIGFVVCGLAVMVGVRRLAPAVALHRVGAVPMGDEVDPRLSNITEGLCATFGLSMPALAVLDDDVPNACALGRDARRSVLVVTRGLLEMLDPIELEGVVAHELAHVKRGDNGVSCVGITLATMFGGESMLRRCVGSTARVPCRRRRCLDGPLSPRAAGRAADHDAGAAAGPRLLLRHPVAPRADPLGMDRPVRRPAGPVARAWRPRCDAGPGRRSGRMVKSRGACLVE